MSVCSVSKSWRCSRCWGWIMKITYRVGIDWESEAYLGSVEVDTQLAQLVHVVNIDLLLPQQVGHLMSQCSCDFATMIGKVSASPRWRTSQRSTSSEGWLQADRLRLAWDVSWYLVEATCERNPKNKYGMRLNDNFVRLFLTLWEKTRVGQFPAPLDRPVLNSLHPGDHPARLRRQHWKVSTPARQRLCF